jgi:type IV secretory pathway TrbD component
MKQNKIDLAIKAATGVLLAVFVAGLQVWITSAVGVVN